jgi:hypothetical protein
MNDKEREAVNAAKATRQPDNRTPRQGKQGGGRANESAQAAGSNLQEKLNQVSDQLANNMKQQIFSKAIVKVLEDFENGDFGELAEQMFLELNQGINAPLETEYRVLEAWQDSPKLSLPSAAALNG